MKLLIPNLLWIISEMTQYDRIVDRKVVYDSHGLMLVILVVESPAVLIAEIRRVSAMITCFFNIGYCIFIISKIK